MDQSRARELGPILFLIFINDLPDDLTSNVRLFADDCIVYNIGRLGIGKIVTNYNRI